jgi:hypothetical protein
MNVEMCAFNIYSSKYSLVSLQMYKSTVVLGVDLEMSINLVLDFSLFNYLQNQL